MFDWNSLAGFLIPFAEYLAISGTIITALIIWSRYKLAQQETLRAAIQSGQKLDEETLKLLLKPKSSPESDLRQGIISTCFALGFAATAALSPLIAPLQATAVLGMIAILIGSVGIGQLVAWKVRTRGKAAPTDPKV